MNWVVSSGHYVSDFSLTKVDDYCAKISSARDMNAWNMDPKASELPTALQHLNLTTDSYRSSHVMQLCNKTHYWWLSQCNTT